MVCLLVVGFGYYHNNSQASISSSDNSKVTKAVKKKRKIIKTNLTNYLNTVTDDGTASVSFYNLGNDDSNSNSQYNQVYQEGSLEVESNASTVKTAASTYKLYLSAFLMGQKQAGNFSWTSDNNTGFTKMIVNSENDFAEEQINNYSADTISSYLKKQGYYGNVFQEGQAAQTTSYSLELLLRDLENGTGSFKNSSDQQKLLNLMGKQIYRTGIPTGVAQANSGTTVQDDTNNDAASVTLPNGQKYVLVIMTDGHNQSGLSGFSRIAEIAKNVQEIVYGKNAGEKNS